MAEIIIRIPTPLRKFTGNQAAVTVTADSVQSAITALIAAWPDLSGQIMGTDGQIRRFVNVYVNDEDIRFLDSFATKLDAGDEVSIIPAIAGGI